MVDIPGEKRDWNGFDERFFEFDGRDCRVVMPKEPRNDWPWLWRARFFGHWPLVDMALLEQGFHVAYIDVSNLYGCPKAVKHWNAFYELLVGKIGFAAKPAMECMSRGGLITFNWASENAEKIACIYGDAPVGSIANWPGGKGAGPGCPENWAMCLDAYGFTEAEAVAYMQNPIDRLKSLAEAKVPLFLVSGDADESVPLDENTHVIEQRYKAFGGDVSVIVKPGVGHIHGLDDASPIVEFMLKHT